MSRSFKAAMALLPAILGGGAALAQPFPPPRAPLAVTVPGPARPVIGPDEELVVREYIIRKRTDPVVRYREEVPAVRYREDVVVREDVRLRPGSFVPAYVELIPTNGWRDPQLAGLGYFVSPDDKVVVVNPATRTVVRIFDR